MYCPDLSSLDNEMDIEGDPWYYGYGSDFTLVVASCKTTANVFGESGQNCVSDDESDIYVSQMRIVYKFVTQYFD